MGALASALVSFHVPILCQGQFLWNAGRVMAAHLEDNAGQLVKGRTVLELGAASGLPSIVCALNGARRVVATDYPDADLLGNLTANAARYCIDVARPCPIAVAVRCHVVQCIRVSDGFRATSGEGPSKR